MTDFFIQGIEETFTQETFDFVCAVKSLLGLSVGDEQIAIICGLFEVDDNSLCTEIQIPRSRITKKQGYNDRLWLA